MSIVFNTAPQGSDEWLAIRKGVITGSRFKDARDRKKNGEMTEKCLGYAYDLAREREGGSAPETYVNAAMRLGTQEEPVARLTYEAETGQFVEEVGFAHTDDLKFGCSVDGLIGADGVWECKTMVSSATLFKAMVDEDIAEYRDQCIGALWLLGRQWVDLTLWCPDLKVLHVIRIERDDNEIDALERDLLAFDRLVEHLRVKLRARLHPKADAQPEPHKVESDSTTTAPIDQLTPTF